MSAEKVENGENHEYKRMKIIRKRVKENESKKMAATRI